MRGSVAVVIDQTRSKQRERRVYPRWALAAVVVVAGILRLTLWPDSTVNSSNFAPLSQHGAAWSCVLRDCPGAVESARFLILDVIGNVAVFILVGYTVAATFSGISRGRRFWLAMASGVLLSLLIETIQFRIATRATDVDDLIFNTLGTAIGAALRRGKAVRPT